MNLQEEFIEIGISYGLIFVQAILLIIIGKLIIRNLLSYFNNLIETNLDSTLSSFIKPITKVILYIIFLAIIGHTIGIEMTPIIAILGAAGLAVGLALQGSISNLAGGILILSFRPFDVGDLIEINDHKGKVSSIQLLYTVLKTRDNKTVVIPNSDLTNNSVINYTKEEKRRVDLVFGIGYDDDILQVKSILEEIVNEHNLILKEPEPIIRVGEHGASSINFNVFVWTSGENYWDVYYDLMEKVKIKFDENDINIPYPQRDIHLYKTN